MQIVAMVTLKDRVFIASPYSVYEMMDGKPVLVVSPADFKRADEEWDKENYQIKPRSTK